MDCSIVIVNYNTKDQLLDCLSSIYAHSPEKYMLEVIVVDNASDDDSVEAVKSVFPDVILLPQPDNLGFSKANNKGISISRGRYILLLNPDTVVEKDTLTEMINYMDYNPQIGVAGCKVVLADGTLDKACKRSFPTPLKAFFHFMGLAKLFPNNKRFGAYNLTYLDEDEINEVDSVVGAFMLVRKEAIDQVGALDEDYFMYGEDIDWCLRIKQAGWKVVYCPIAKIIHYKRTSSSKRRIQSLYHFYNSMLIFYRKHYKRKYGIMVTFLVYLGILGAFSLALLKNLIKR